MLEPDVLGERMRMMFSLKIVTRRLNDQGGFSMVEVVMAVVLFTSAVVGISGMVLSGGADIASSASENVAAGLANKKIEEVRSLPFYKPWDGKNQDIDDYYYNKGPGMSNGDQIDNPGQVEDYGSISEGSKYKRTTAVQYQVPSGSSMSSAVMASTWVPSNPNLTAGQIDSPTTSTPTTAIHSLIIEVAVYYRVDNQQRVYKQRALAGDMIIPGGSSIPVLMVTEINPATALNTVNNQIIKVTVSAKESITGGNFDVRLWAAGSSDIVGMNVTIVNGHEIDATFDFTASGVKPGLYNILVNWIDQGWQDKGFRNCFTLVGPPPTITGITNFNWGFKQQASRQITVNGTNLANPRYVELVGPNEGGSGSSPTPSNSIICPTASITSSSSTQIVANFNLNSVPDDSLNTHWNVHVVTWGGEVTSSTDSKRLLVNPPPQITSVTCTPATLYRKVNYANAVLVKGKYFQPGATPLSVKLTKTNCTDISGSYTSSGTVTEDGTAGTAQFTISGLDLRRNDSTDNNRPIRIGNGANEIGNWTLYVTNPDGQISAQTNMYVPVGHATPTISSVTGATVYNDWDVATTVSGSYFDPDYSTVYMQDQYGITGTIAVTGAYGSGQSLGSGLVMNTINLSAQNYSITVSDTENGKTSSNYSYAIAAPANDAVSVMAAGTTAPAGCTWPITNAFWNDSGISNSTTDTVAATNICQDNGSRTYKIIAKKMKPSNVKWSLKGNGSPSNTYTFVATPSYSRANKYIMASGTIAWYNWTGSIITVDVKCSNNNSSTYGPTASGRIRVQP